MCVKERGEIKRGNQRRKGGISISIHQHIKGEEVVVTGGQEKGASSFLYVKGKKAKEKGEKDYNTLEGYFL